MKRNLYFIIIFSVIIASATIRVQSAPATPAAGNYSIGYQGEDESAIKKVTVCDGDIEVFAWGAGKDLLRIRAQLSGTEFTVSPFLIDDSITKRSGREDCRRISD